MLPSKPQSLVLGREETLLLWNKLIGISPRNLSVLLISFKRSSDEIRMGRNLFKCKMNSTNIYWVPSMDQARGRAWWTEMNVETSSPSQCQKC